MQNVALTGCISPVRQSLTAVPQSLTGIHESGVACRDFLQAKRVCPVPPLHNGTIRSAVRQATSDLLITDERCSINHSAGTFNPKILL